MKFQIQDTEPEKELEVEVWLQQGKEGEVKLMLRAPAFGGNPYNYEVGKLTVNGFYRARGVSGCGLRTTNESAIYDCGEYSIR